MGMPLFYLRITINWRYGVKLVLNESFFISKMNSEAGKIRGTNHWCSWTKQVYMDLLIRSKDLIVYKASFEQIKQEIITGEKIKNIYQGKYQTKNAIRNFPWH